MTYFLVILMTTLFATAAIAETDSVIGDRKCKIVQTC